MTQYQRDGDGNATVDGSTRSGSEDAARVVVGEGTSDEFEVNIGLRQSSVLIPLRFVAVLDFISTKTVTKDVLR